ncbi:MAG: transcriptional regulator, partial [Burkholderiales bacterium]|nr:transcriptional regulator [Burkholderiales bacterium]
MTFARTKIQPPRPRPGFVPRGAVQARLAQALLARRLVLLCAPGGYGKTTLLAEEIARMGAGHAVAWVSVDAGDDLHRLLDCMVTALEPYDPPWRTAPEALIAAAARGAADEQRKVAAELVNTLDACEVAHGVVVVDDVHRVDDPAFFQFLDVVVERLSPRWTVALTTRDEPPLALARLRARDELAELREVQLRFARDEARRLAAAAGVEASVADRLFERTHGWPAGMRIALGALGGGTLAALDERALRTVERPMFDFLVTEVLAQLRPELADFLLATSVLPELEATRCEAVTGTAHAARLLDEIERLGLFVDVLDAPARTLRLHDLFRDALLQRLELDAPQRLAELRARAAASEPDPVRRIGFLIAAGEHEQAAQLVFEHLPLRMPVSGPSGAVHVLGQFPAAFRERSPELLYVRGLVAYLRWEFGAMFELQQRAEAGFAARDDAERLGMARASRVMALIALGRMDEAGDLLATLRGERLSLAGRILMLNAESWLALDTGRGYEVAGIVDAMLDLLEDAGRPDLWYQT